MACHLEKPWKTKTTFISVAASSWAMILTLAARTATGKALSVILTWLKVSGWRWLLILGGLGLVAGVGLAIFGGFQASGTTDLGDQVAFLATGTLIGLALVIAGAALFVRYSIARFMRFWLVRLVHEHRSETDRVIGALKEIETKLNK
jgi:hypothetical protein